MYWTTSVYLVPWHSARYQYVQADERNESRGERGMPHHSEEVGLYK